MMGAFSGMRICDTKAFSGWRRILKITTLGEDGEAPLLPLNHLESTSQNLSFAHEQLPTNSRGYLRFISGSSPVPRRSLTPTRNPCGSQSLPRRPSSRAKKNRTDGVKRRWTLSSTRRGF